MRRENYAHYDLGFCRFPEIFDTCFEHSNGRVILFRGRGGRTSFPCGKIKGVHELDTNGNTIIRSDTPGVVAYMNAYTECWTCYLT